jgi:hypothetical protein
MQAPAADGAAEPEPIEHWLAVRRLESSLQRLGMARNRHRDLVIQNCMARALGRWRQQPRADLSALALEEVDDALGRWFSFVLGEESLGEQSPILVGQAALEACQAARHWPHVLLTYDQVPSAFIEAMRTAQLTPTPPELPGSMLEQDLEFWSLRDLPTRFLGRWTRGLSRPAAPAA